MLLEIQEKIKDRVVKEPRKSFVVRFKGQVIGASFEKTLKIISKRLFIKGEIGSINTFKEQGFVEAKMTATLSEVESLVQYLSKPHIVLHCKTGIAKDASNLLIIDEEEQSQLDDFTPDYTHRNTIWGFERY